MATVFEAGNHISQIADGRLRRASAEHFAKAIQDAIDDQAPWKPMRLPEAQDIRAWLDDMWGGALESFKAELDQEADRPGSEPQKNE